MRMKIDKLRANRSGETPKNIVFICNQLEINLLQGLLEALEGDIRFDITVIAAECIGSTFSPHISQDEIESRLRSAKIDYKKAIDVDLTDYEGAIFMTSLPYDIYLPEKFKSSELVSHGTLVNLNYGVRLVKDEGIYAMPLGSNPYLKRCRYVFVDEKIKVSNINFKQIGSAKVFFYRDLFFDKEVRTLKTGVVSIAWKPRWTQAKDSNLFPLLENFNHFLSANQRAELILVEHPLLRSKLNEMGTLKIFEAWEAQVQKLGNYSCLQSDEGLKKCIQSDVLISDVSSSMYEFSFTGRPIIYTTNNLPLNDAGKKLARVSYNASDPEKIFWILENLFNGIDPLQKRRQKYKRKKARNLRNPYKKMLNTLSTLN
jgi:hypothetical protein